MASRLCTRMRFSRMGLLALLLGGVGTLPLQAFALGLGEIVLDSALNERLEARIPLVDADGLQPDEIKISLASAEDFERVGVERFFFLSDLQFSVEMAHSGTGVVAVTSAKPITEPYLNFLVQVQWPQGRLLKEFTLLLDPPTFSEAPAPAVSSAVQAAPSTASGGIIERPPAPIAAPEAPARAAPPVTAQRPPGVPRGAPLDGERMTGRDDTLWSIAKAARPSDAVTVQQTMLAIQRLNPDAFLDGNINRLKAGYVLDMPSESEVLKVNAAEALEQVAAQDRAWRGQSTAATPPAPEATEPAAIDATPEPAAAAPAVAGTEGRLRIVAGEGDSAAGSATAAADAEALAAALEERDRLNLEVADLTSQLDREKELAANLLAVKDRQIEIKDQQIAEMQAELARMGEAAGTSGTGEQNQDQSASAPAAAWWQSPAVLGGGGGVLVLLLAGALIAARRRRATMEDAAPAREVPVARSPEPRLAEHAETDVGGAAKRVLPAGAGVVPVAGGTPSVLPGGMSPNGEVVDVIGEADIYIAYGRYGQAASLLQTALTEAPDRHDVRLKLLEVHSLSGDRDAFERTRAELTARTADPDLLARADRLAGAAEPVPAGAVATATLGAGGISAAAALAAHTAVSHGETDVEPRATTEPMLETLDRAPEASTADRAADLDRPVEVSELDLDLDLDLPEASAADQARIDRAEASVEIPDLELELESLEAEPEALEAPSVFDEPIAPATELEFDMEAGELTAPDQSTPRLDDELRSAASGILGGDLGIDFRLEAEDLEALDEAELALEMDGPAGAEDEFDFPDDTDAVSTKLDLARAYSEMGDTEGAREILLEVLNEGSASQQQAAQELLDRL